MITQLFKILWKQRRYNSLLMIEIVFSFIALFMLLAVIIHYYKRYKEPLGMDYVNLWAIHIEQDWNIPTDQKLSDSMKYVKYEALKKYLQTNSQVISATKATFNDFIYAQSASSSCINFNKNEYCYNTFDAETDFAKTTGLKITEGRWLLPEDELSKIKTVVINSRFRKELFGKAPAAGKTITVGEDKNIYQIKIVGVFEHLKRFGEFAEEPNFLAMALPKPINYFAYGGMLLKLKGPITSDFEAQLAHDLITFDNSFEYRIEKVEQMHRQYMLSELAPIIIASAVVLFLIVNVMLGLFGSLWLNISRRKSEFGLRRAIGGTGSSILMYILGETYVLAFVSVIIGFLFTMQLFIYNLYYTSYATLIEANLLAFVIILLMCTISAYAPGQLAASLKPAEALHEE
jgi:putative ABC transport system permease protein